MSAKNPMVEFTHDPLVEAVISSVKRLRDERGLTDEEVASMRLYLGATLVRLETMKMVAGGLLLADWIHEMRDLKVYLPEDAPLPGY